MHKPFMKYFSGLLASMKCGGVRLEYGSGGACGIDEGGVARQE
jgi:hypothetical protein